MQSLHHPRMLAGLPRPRAQASLVACELEVARAEVQTIRQQQEAERGRVKKAIAEMKRKIDTWVTPCAGPFEARLGCGAAWEVASRWQLAPTWLLSPAACPCRLQKEKREAEAAGLETRGKAAEELEALRAGAAAAEQRLQAAKVPGAVALSAVAGQCWPACSRDAHAAITAADLPAHARSPSAALRTTASG